VAHRDASWCRQAASARESCDGNEAGRIEASNQGQGDVHITFTVDFCLLGKYGGVDEGDCTCTGS
jgi:hypothetical protein